MHSARPLGDWTQQVNLVHLLKRASIPQAQGGCSTNDKNRATCKVCICYTCNAISYAWACCQNSHSGSTCAFGPSFGSVNCCLFVASIHDSNSFAFATIINCSNMSSAKGENNLDTFSFQNLGDNPTAVNHAHGELRSLHDV